MTTATKKLELKTSTTYFRDAFLPFADANLSISSAPVLYGLSAYTVMSATYNMVEDRLYIFRLRDHYKRLINSAKVMDFGGFESEWSYDKFEKTITELLKQNTVTQDVLIRVTLFVDEILSGTKMRGLKTNVSIFIYPTESLYVKDQIDVCVSSWKRTPDNAIPSRAKVNGSYVNSALMKNEALLNGYDDAIALDENGHVTEATVANLFMVKAGQLITPHSATDILEGITRDTMQKLAKQLGIEHQERAIDRSELYTADEVFLCGTTAKITPVVSVDRRLIGQGKTGPVTQILRDEYRAAQQGTNNVFKYWQTVVNTV